MKRKFLRQKTGGRSPAPVVNKRLSFSLGKNNRDTNRNTNRNKDSDRNRDEDISSDEEMDDDRNDDEEDSKDNDDSDEEEDPEAKRKRLAKQYLSAFQSLDQDSDENDSNDDGGVGPSLSVSEHLKMNRLAKEGKYFQELSTKVAAMDIDSLTKHSNTFQSTVTAVAATTDSTKIYCTGKDNSICCIDTETNTKTIVKNRWLGAEDDAAHKRDGEQLCVAVTTDGRYVAAGGKDNKIRIYDSRTNNSEVKVFTGHKDAVTCLTFQKDTYALFSGSLDRCIKYWDLNEMGYLETLFGHQVRYFWHNLLL